MSDTNEALRPKTLTDFIGQEKMKSRLAPFIAESIECATPMVHILLTSEPGCGKTSIAEVVANELGDPFATIDLSQMNDNQFASYMRRSEGGVILVDEIHRARPHAQEALLTLMEQGFLNTKYGGRIAVPWVTIIAATTEPHRILPSVASRFALKVDFDPYEDSEISLMVTAMAYELNLEMTDEDANALGNAAGGIPRAARDLVKAWRALSFQGTPTVEKTLALAGREADGLTDGHLKYLRTLDQLEGHSGERVLCSILRMHPSQLNSIERLLVMRGLIGMTPTGRVLTSAGDARMRGVREQRTFRKGNTPMART